MLKIEKILNIKKNSLELSNIIKNFVYIFSLFLSSHGKLLNNYQICK